MNNINHRQKLSLILVPVMVLYVFLPCIAQASSINDALMQHVQAVPVYTPPANSKTLTYYEQGSSIMDTADGNGYISSYLGRNIRTVIDTNNSSYQTNYLIKNGKDVIGKTQNGIKLSKTYQYTPYGENVDLTNSSPQPPTSNTQSLTTNPFRYSSYYLDSESGLYYLNARYYSPELMRFISRDTYDLNNRYAYGNGNPIGNVDPTGHSVLGLITTGLSFGAAIAGAFSTGGTSILFYMASNIIYSGTSMVSDGLKKNWLGVAANALFLIQGTIGATGAIPQSFAEGEGSYKNLWNIKEAGVPDLIDVHGMEKAEAEEAADKAVNGAEMNAVKESAKTTSIYSGFIQGAGSGMLFKPKKGSAAERWILTAAYTLTGALIGGTFGMKYGETNLQKVESFSVKRSFAFGVKRTGLNSLGTQSLFSAVSQDTSDIASGTFNIEKDAIANAEDFAFPMIFGGISGVTQNMEEYGSAVGRHGKMFGKIIRRSYLVAKNGMLGQLLGNDGAQKFGNYLNPTNGLIN